MSDAVRLESRWDRFWFGEASLVRLAVFRIVIMATALYALYQFEDSVFQQAQDVTYRYMRTSWRPIYAFEVLHLGPPDAAAATALFGILLAAILLGAVGLCSRVACAVAAALSLYWIGVAYSVGKPHHDCIALAFALAALPFAPVGARLSVDALIARWRRASRGEDGVEAPTLAARAALPLRLTQITIALGYVFSGWTKLAVSGFGWANGYTLQGIMLEFDAPWTDFFAGEPAWCAAMSVGLLAFQTSFFLIFVRAVLRWVFIPLAVAFHVMTWKTMSTGPFLTLWFTLACFVPWERTPAFLSARVLAGPAWRRVLWSAATLAAAAGLVRAYFEFLPRVYALGLLPLVVALALPVLAPTPLRVPVDRSRRGGARLAAVLRGLDWTRRLRLVEPSADATPADAPRAAALVRRLPALLLASPLLAVPVVRRATQGLLERFGTGPAWTAEPSEAKLT